MKIKIDIRYQTVIFDSVGHKVNIIFLVEKEIYIFLICLSIFRLKSWVSLLQGRKVIAYIKYIFKKD